MFRVVVSLPWRGSQQTWHTLRRRRHESAARDGERRKRGRQKAFVNEVMSFAWTVNASVFIVIVRSQLLRSLPTHSAVTENEIHLIAIVAPATASADASAKQIASTSESGATMSISEAGRGLGPTYSWRNAVAKTSRRRLSSADDLFKSSRTICAVLAFAFVFFTRSARSVS